MTDDGLRTMERAMSKLKDMWFIEGSESVECVDFTREERDLIVAALNLAISLCALVDDVKRR
jgi:hypothetical protein